MNSSPGAQVEIKFADNAPLRTQVCRRTLTPVWQQDFRIEVADDCDLQDHPLLLVVWDKDLMSSDDEIGAVAIDLNPLLGQLGKIQGWFPLYDTLHGIRGELSLQVRAPAAPSLARRRSAGHGQAARLLRADPRTAAPSPQVKMDFIGDINPFKESGAGVQFYALPRAPPDKRLLALVGLVEELVVVTDPEFHWLDPIRTARLSNERRQLLLYALTGKLRRQMGRKVLEAGGNAVLGFDVAFDLEGEVSSLLLPAPRS